MASKTTTTKAQKDDQGKARNKVYYAARAELIENHQGEYRQLLQKHADEAGVSLTIRLTPEEKAAKQMEDLIAQYPELAGRLSADRGADPVDPEARFQDAADEVANA